MKKLLYAAVLLLPFPLSAQSLDDSGVDLLLMRITEMEGVIARQTDTIERFSHRIDTLESRIENINADIAVRFEELQRNPPQSSQQPPMETTPKNRGPFSSEQETPPQSAHSPKELYDLGMSLTKEGDYARAGEHFRRLIDSHPDNELVPNAYYWLGETYYARKDFQNAAVVFADGFKKFPKGHKAPDNLLKLGLSMQSLKKNAEACTAFLGVQKEFPNAPESILNKAKSESKKLSCK